MIFIHQSGCASLLPGRAFPFRSSFSVIMVSLMWVMGLCSVELIAGAQEKVCSKKHESQEQFSNYT
jgi:hypothetical protein